MPMRTLRPKPARTDTEPEDSPGPKRKQPAPKNDTAEQRAKKQNIPQPKGQADDVEEADKDREHDILPTGPKLPKRKRTDNVEDTEADIPALKRKKATAVKSLSVKFLPDLSQSSASRVANPLPPKIPEPPQPSASHVADPLAPKVQRTKAANKTAATVTRVKPAKPALTPRSQPV
jgi:hypothetical protein